MTTSPPNLNQQAADLLAALLAEYVKTAPATMDAHRVMASAGNLIEALRAGRVRIVKGDGWRE